MRGEVMQANINAWRGSTEMNFDGVFSVHVDAIGAVEYELHPGVRKRTTYVLEGNFHDGAREYPAGSFIHNPVGSSHIPQSATGCKLLVILPLG